MALEFPVVEASRADERDLERFRRRPGTIQCDLVKFDVGPLIELIRDLDEGRIGIAESLVALRIFGDDLGEFQGSEFELNREREIPGPYVWSGLSTEIPRAIVSVSINRMRVADVIVNTGLAVYRTHITRSSGNYILCKLDGAQRERRID